MKLDRNGKTGVTLKLLAIDKQNLVKKVESEHRTMQGQLEYLVQQYLYGGNDEKVIQTHNTTAVRKEGPL